MPDGFTPVATQIQPPNPMAGLQAYSTLLGIQQQGIGIQQAKQNLQTGQYLQQSAQAEAQRAQMDQQQYQAIGSVIRDPSNYDENGSMTAAGRTKLRGVAPNLADAAYQQAVQSGEATTRYKGAMLDLSNSQRQTVANAVAGVVSNGGSAEDVTKALLQLTEKDPQLTEAAMRINGLLSGAKDQQHFQAIAAGIAQGTNAPAGEHMRPGAASYAAPGNKMGFVQTNPQAPGGVAPIGPQVPTAPSLSVITPPGAPPQTFNSSTGTTAPLRGSGGDGGTPFLSEQDAATIGKQKDAATSHVIATQSAAGSIGNNRTMYDNVLNLIPHTMLGPIAGRTGSIARALGLDQGAHLDVIEHNLEQSTATARAAMGLPNTNAGQEGAAKVGGATTMSGAGLREIVKQNSAINEALAMYNAGLTARTMGHPVDAGQVQQYRQAWNAAYDADYFRYADAVRRKDKEEIAAINKKRGPAGMAELAQKGRQIEALAGTQ